MRMTLHAHSEKRQQTRRPRVVRAPVLDHAWHAHPNRPCAAAAASYSASAANEIVQTVEV